MIDSDRERFLANIRSRAQLEIALIQVRDAIRMAQVRAQSLKTVIRRVLNILSDEDRERIIYRLSEVDLRSEADEFEELLEQLSLEWEQLPSREKARADAVLLRLVRALPEPNGSRLALKLLAHPRKRRRDGAYKVLRNRSISADLVEEFRALTESTGEQELFHLIARNPLLAAAMDEHYLLEHIEDPYWQMRVIEVLLREAPHRAVALAHRHAVPFAHAVGRLAAREYSPELRVLFRQHKADPEFLSIYAWALGKIGDAESLNEVREAMEVLQAKLEAESEWGNDVAGA